MVAEADNAGQTGQRGFLLTGEDRYLEPFQGALKAIDRHIQNLRELTADNPDQQKRVNTLQTLTAEKLAELADTIALRRQRGERAALQMVLTDKGRNSMDEVRRLIGIMEDGESELLRQRDLRAKATAHFAVGAMVFGGLLVLELVSTVGVLIQRSITLPLAAFMQFVSQKATSETSRSWARLMIMRMARPADSIEIHAVQRGRL
jgi:CHASE3 domain sensor protein